MSRRRIVIGVGGLAVLLVAAGAVFALTRPGDVSNPDVAFQEEPTPTPVPTQTPEPRKRKKADPLAGFQWPQYGFGKDRRRFIATGPQIKPPFHMRWSFNAHVLLEFPPIIVGNRLFFTTNDGRVIALNRLTGKRVWKRDMGYLAASSPAYGDGRIFVTILERKKGVKAGRVAALRARDGKLVWSRPLASRSESSPIYSQGRVFFGAEDGSVYALRAGNGTVSWKYRAGGAVKGGLAMDGGKVYFGAYGGSVYALWQRNGGVAWTAGTSGATFGLSSGNFYSTPAVGYGRVYIGNTDGNMYSFSSESGELAWRRGTGSYVYASPAIAQPRGGRPTVYFGSYDGTFYALDARSGDTRWSFEDGGKISGAATVVGGVVYYSNWGKRNTAGLDIRTGKKVWSNERGAFNPVVANEDEIYLTGFSSVAALQPRAIYKRERAQARKRKQARKRAQAQKRAERDSARD